MRISNNRLASDADRARNVMARYRSLLLVHATTLATALATCPEHDFPFRSVYTRNTRRNSMRSFYGFALAVTALLIASPVGAWAQQPPPSQGQAAPGRGPR